VNKANEVNNLDECFVLALLYSRIVQIVKS